jgi:hypothetical protein
MGIEMDFYNTNWPTTRTMSLYDCVELQHPIGFVHFKQKPDMPVTPESSAVYRDGEMKVMQ